MMVPSVNSLETLRDTPTREALEEDGPLPQLTALLTHENPDMDAALCVWLLRRFGEKRYPGVGKLPVLFYPAGVMPGGEHPDVLEEQRGILAVDTGGGRLDTHSRDGKIDTEKRNTSAARLVAQDLGVTELPELQKLLKFVTLQETRGRSIASSHPMDHLVSLSNLIRGLNLLHRDRPEKVIEIVGELYDAAFTTEQEWFQALSDFQGAYAKNLDGGAKLVAVISDSGAAVKVARLKKADLVIHRNLEGHTGITVRNNGHLKTLNLDCVAQVVRIAESIRANEPVDYERLSLPGIHNGWYLHDSGRILSKGSPKNRELPPSKIEVNTVLELCAARLDAAVPMPAEFCARASSPEGSCIGCPFEPLKLETCGRLCAAEMSKHS